MQGEGIASKLSRMRLKNIILVFLFVYASRLYSKDTIQGYLVTLEMDTVRCSFELASRDKVKNIFYIENQSQVKKLSADGKIEKLNPYSIKGYTLFYPDDTLIYWSVALRYEEYAQKYITEKNFYLLEINGFIKLYKVYQQQNGAPGYVAGAGGAPGMMIPGGSLSGGIHVYYEMQKNNEDLDLHRGSYRKYFKKFFSDNAAIVKKIDDKVYREKDLPMIVKEYNKWHEAKGMTDPAVH
jgi:hypothetical protein